MKKKFIALFLTALCTVSLLGGCGKTEKNIANTNVEKTEKVEQTEKAETKKTTSVTLNEVAHSIV